MDDGTSLWRRAVSPLHIAAYVTWAAVAYGVWHDAARWTGFGPLSGQAVAALGLGVFLLGFLANARDEEVLGRTRARGPAVMVLALVALFLAGPSGTSPILMIILAAVLFACLPPRVASAALIAVNVAFLLIAVLHWQMSNPVLGLALYGGFQLFAAMTMLATRRAEEMAGELGTVNARLLATRELLVESARDRERLRVSRDLHDVAGHKLTALKLNLEVLARDPVLRGRRELDVARQMAAELLEDVRHVVSELRDSEGIKLDHALRELIAPVPRPRVHLDVDPGARAPDAAGAEAVVRAAQEGLTNALRHAGADNVWISVRQTTDGLELKVEDDGAYRGRYVAGHGLTGMRERLQALGGELDTGRGEHGGFRLRARLPAGGAA